MSVFRLARGLPAVSALTVVVVVLSTASTAQEAPPAAPPPAAPPPSAPPPIAAPEPVPLPVQAFGRDHLTCLEWSDSCVVCQRDDAGATHCSTVAIACLPQAVLCSREKP